MITHGLKKTGWRWAAVLLCCAPAAVAQVDPQRAAGYFKEAAALCERENGKLWGVSLCGPMVIADAATHTIATSQPAPDAKQPAMLGFANSAMEWGGTRWSTLVWQMIPADAHARGRLMMHELFHRVQPQLGFQIRDGQLDHLDTVDGRYWMQLEWRALAKALGASGPARTAALRDALAFRTARRKVFPNAAENERLLEMNEGLAQYTGTVAAAATCRRCDQPTRSNNWRRQPRSRRSYGPSRILRAPLTACCWTNTRLAGRVASNMPTISGNW